jgi:hypothetical protein
MMRKMRTKHSDRLVLFSTGEQHRTQPALMSDKMITDLKVFKQTAEKFNF